MKKLLLILTLTMTTILGYGQTFPADVVKPNFKVKKDTIPARRADKNVVVLCLDDLLTQLRKFKSKPAPVALRDAVLAA